MSASSARPSVPALWSAGLAAAALACDARAPVELVSEPPFNPAIEVRDTTRDAFSLPMPGLGAAELARFFVGNSFFNQNWVAAPASVHDRDGLGPLFNARSCSSCHFKDGRGKPPEAGEAPRGFLLRLSRGRQGAHGAPQPDPVYGDQLQTEALSGLSPEAQIGLDYEPLEGRYTDGERYLLQRPRYTLQRPGYGPISPLLQLSPRVAPQLIGLGLLEAVSEQQLQRMADPEDRDHDGISGRVQRVPDASTGGSSAGRFGWKAEQSTLPAQIAAAFLGDMGITSEAFPRENHSAEQGDCSQRASGGSPELTPNTLDAVAAYTRTLALPAPRTLERALAAEGGALFARARCDACHRPELSSAERASMPLLSRRTFRPFTDLLLHDLGPELSDARPSFGASGSEWRTPPLWGIGLLPKVNGHQRLLHDGRARGVAEAILWHGGEAEPSRRAFASMSGRERAALTAFVESL
ncbi:MAG TPA: di-heme oxidoredictase family protein [Polyangiales bacterium]